MDPKVEAIVNQLKQYNPDKIILFGSYAHGHPHEDSDVDLAVIKKTSDSFHERNVKARLLVRTTTPVDILVFTPEEFEARRKTSLFIKEIAEKGKVVYG